MMFGFCDKLHSYYCARQLKNELLSPLRSSMMFGFGDKGTTNLMTRALASVGEAGDGGRASCCLLLVACVGEAGRDGQLLPATPGGKASCRLQRKACGTERMAALAHPWGIPRAATVARS